MSAYDGQLATTPLPLVLQRIASQGGTGILTIQGDVDIVAVSFLEGEVVAADALNQTVEDGLGQVLVDQGLLTSARFEAAAAEYQGGSGGTLGDLLVRRGLLSRNDLLKALREQTYRLLKQLMDWEEGEFKFYAGDEVSHEEGMKPLTVEEVLVGSISAAGGLDDGPTGPDMDAVYRALPAAKPVDVLGDLATPQVEDDPDRLWLTPEELRLWQTADGQHTARTVSAGMDPAKVRIALTRLLQLGLVEAAEVEGVLTRQVGTTEIFRPPDPDQSVRRGAADAATQRAWIGVAGWGLGAIAAIALAFTLVVRPNAVLLPLPWHEAQRDGLERQLRQSLYQQIERGARTHFLMENRFPSSLIELVDARLLPPRAMREPSGAPLNYRGDEQHYEIGVRLADDLEPEMRTVSASPDDFLAVASEAAEDDDVAPLYLID